MKKLATSFLLVLLGFFIGQKIQIEASFSLSDDPPCTQFECSLEQYLTAVQTRDMELMKPTLSNDKLTLILPDATRIEGRDAFIEMQEAWFEDDSWTWTPEILSSHEGDDYGYALVRYVYETDEPLYRSESYLLLIFQDTNDGPWKLVFDQNTNISRTLPAE